MRFNSVLFFFLRVTATTEIYTLSLHDALPIFRRAQDCTSSWGRFSPTHPDSFPQRASVSPARAVRSEEHTSELQSRPHLVCRLLLEKKNPSTSALSNQLHATITLRSSAPSRPG